MGEAPVKDYSTEADARIVIDDLLRQAGWDPADKSQVLTEISIRDTSWMIAETRHPMDTNPAGKIKRAMRYQPVALTMS